MQLLRGDRRQRLDTLINMGTVLAVLLVILVVFTLLTDILHFLGRFKQPIFLFIFGAVLAYVVVPLVHRLRPVVRKQWAAVAVAYLLMFLTLALLAVLLLNPFIKEARALVSALHNPAASSLQSFNSVRIELGTIQSNIVEQQRRVNNGHALPRQTLQSTRAEIGAVKQAVAKLSTTMSTKGQIQVPPSYVVPIQVALRGLARDYGEVAKTPPSSQIGPLDRAVSDAKTASSAATASYRKASSTPLLLLSLQVWLDRHGVNADLHDKFGRAVQDVSNQFASLLSNAVTVALQAGNLFLNVILILLISIYWVSDGGRFVRWLVSLLPLGARDEATYLVGRLDSVLGTYIRTMLFLAALAGVLDAMGAVIFGVPYPIVIFFSTFFLSLIPVIGSLIMYFPPMLIALAFTPLPRPIFYFVWLLAGEQLVTNIIGPRVTGHSVGIHPLESMAAAFVGYPLAGLVGSFLAVPITAFLHIAVRELRHGSRIQEPATQPDGTGAKLVQPARPPVDEEVPP